MKIMLCFLFLVLGALCYPSCYLKTFYINGGGNDIDYELRCFNPSTSGEITTGLFHYDVEFQESVDKASDCSTWTVQYDYTNQNLELVGKDTSVVDFCGVVIYDAGNEKRVPKKYLEKVDNNLGCSCNYNVSNSKKFAFVTASSNHQTERNTDGCSCEMYSPGDLDKIETVQCDESAWKITNTTTAVFLTASPSVNSKCDIHITWKSYHPA